MSGPSLELLFLGSGNAFGVQGRAFSSFLLNGRYLFDCGPTVLQQLNQAGVSPDDIEVVFISHFHADHFFGVPFFFLMSWARGRKDPLTIVGPPGVEDKVRTLLTVGYPHLVEDPGFEVRFVEVSEGFTGDVPGLRFSAAQVKHVPSLECFAYRANIGDRSLVYSGDTTLCDSLLCLAKDADVIVVECSCQGVEVHLSPSEVETVAQQSPGAKVIVTHLDGHAHPQGFDGLIVAEDLKLFQF
jgi:ribonuclease BN (tRNA processing enzyme)